MLLANAAHAMMTAQASPYAGSMKLPLRQF
jgi:hypothetical protein